jgi:hypothetical protein
MTTDLEGRLREALHEDAQRARLVNPDRPPAPNASVSRADDHGRSALDLDSGDDPDDWVVPMEEITVSDPSTTNQRTHRRRVLVAAAAIVVVIAAVGIAIRIEDDSSRVATTTPTPTTAPPDESCPLTAEEVSEAIGVTGTHPGSEVCEFGTGIGNSASYSDQLDVACTRASLRKAGYSDAVDGLGVAAYSHVEGLGMALVVCNGDHPFEVHVDIIGDQVAAAVALARLVLSG